MLRTLQDATDNAIDSVDATVHCANATHLSRKVSKHSTLGVFAVDHVRQVVHHHLHPFRVEESSSSLRVDDDDPTLDHHGLAELDGCCQLDDAPEAKERHVFFGCLSRVAGQKRVLLLSGR